MKRNKMFQSIIHIKIHYMSMLISFKFNYIPYKLNKIIVLIYLLSILRFNYVHKHKIYNNI